MNSRIQIYLMMAFKLYDATIMAGCFAAAAAAAQAQQGTLLLHDFLAVRLQVANFAIFLALLFIWHLIFTSLDLYESKRLSTSPFADAPDVLKATSLGTLVLLLAGTLFSVTIITPIFLIIFWVLSSALMIASRVALRYVLHKVRRWGRNLKHVVVIGTNQRAVEIGKKLEATRELGYRLVGFVDDHWHRANADEPAGYSLVADLSGFQTYLQDHVVDEVIICVPIKSFYDKASQIIAQCDEQGILVRFASDIFAPTQRRALVDEFDDQYVVTVNPVTYNDGLLIKHLLDFIVALSLLTVLSPLFLVVALLVKITSPGPVLFVQERVGLNKRRFCLYKFRTMVADAETRLAGIEHLNEVSGPVFKISEDPRITPLGGLLRRTSIDELPQLINVVMGDMSLVGPRPLPVRDYHGFDQDSHRRRLSVRPGITGLWQVEGRSSIAFDQWMELDLQYIDNWSLWLDLKILFKTIPAVLKGTGAS